MAGDNPDRKILRIDGEGEPFHQSVNPAIRAARLFREAKTIGETVVLRQIADVKQPASQRIGYKILLVGGSIDKTAVAVSPSN